MNKRFRRRGGFTLVEITVVITFLALMAAFVVPNMVAIKRTRDLQDMEAALARLPMEARNEARRARVPVSLRVEGNDVVLERQASPDEPDADPEVFRRVALIQDTQVETALTGEDSVDLASWQWTVYPDGSADASGALTFAVGQKQKALALSPSGESRWFDDANTVSNSNTAVAAAAPTGIIVEDRWAAGEREQRGLGE